MSSNSYEIPAEYKKILNERADAWSEMERAEQETSRKVTQLLSEVGQQGSSTPVGDLNGHLPLPEQIDVAMRQAEEGLRERKGLLDRRSELAAEIQQIEQHAQAMWLWLGAGVLILILLVWWAAS